MARRSRKGWDDDVEFLKRLEVLRVEGVYAAHAVSEHGGHELQVKHLPSENGAAAQQLRQALDQVRGNGEQGQTGQGQELVDFASASADANGALTRRGLVTTA